MIYGIGTDLVEINRINKLYRIFNKRFLNKLLSVSELSRFDNIKHIEKQINFLATRWAAKEALVKALGVGFRGGIYLSELTISNNELGQPQVILSVNAHRIISNLLLNKKFKTHVSLSDEDNYAIAYVIIELIS